MKQRATCGSNHKLLVASIAMKLQTTTYDNRIKMYDTEQFHNHVRSMEVPNSTTKLKTL